MVKFLRRDAHRFSKFGFGRGKKAKWRRPTGRDNKLREKRRGYGAFVSIGYGKPKDLRGKLESKNPIIILKVEDLEKIGKEEIGFVGKVGQKRKIEIAKKANELKIELKNLNVKSFLKDLEKKKKLKENKK